MCVCVCIGVGGCVCVRVCVGGWMCDVRVWVGGCVMCVCVRACVRTRVVSVCLKIFIF